MIPELRNLYGNPSFETNLTGWASGWMSRTQSSEWAWAGTYSLKAVVTGDTAAPYIYTVTTSGTVNYPAVQPSTPHSVGMMVKATVPGRYARMYVTYYDASNAQIGSSFSGFIPLSDTQPTLVKVENAVGTSAAAYMRTLIYVYSGTTTTSYLPIGEVFYFDGLMGHEGEKFAGYVDGSLGSRYHWTGTAHASQSYVEAHPELVSTGRGGSLTIGSRIFHVTPDGIRIRDITDAVVGGNFDINIDRDGPKGTIRLQLYDPTVVSEFDWIKIYSYIVHENGQTEFEPVGMYQLENPTDHMDAGGQITEYGGFDATIRLYSRYTSSTITLAAGTNIVSHIRASLNAIGVRHRIPDSTATINAAGKSWDPGTNEYTRLNQCCAAAGLFSLYADGEGIITTIPSRDLYSVEPAHTYVVGENSDLVGDMIFEPVDNSVFNRVVVVRDDPAAGTTLTATRDFNDPRSRIAQSKIGVRTRLYTLQDAANQAAVDAYADARIADLTMYVNGTLQALVRPSFKVHEVIMLDLSGLASEAPSALDRMGRYYVKEHSYPIGGTDSIMRMGVRRIERFDY